MQKIHRLGAILLAVTLVARRAAGAFAQELFTWTDEDGRLHFTSEPPEKTGAILQIDKGASNAPAAIPEKPSAGGGNPAAPGEAAQALRLEADQAWRSVADAVRQAEALRRQADQYIDKVGPKSKKQKSLRYKMRDKVEAARGAEERVRKLRSAAEAAEERAAAAEAQTEERPPREPPPGATEELR